MKRLLLPLLASIGLGTGCYATGDVGATYSAGYSTGYVSPELYYVSPGVSVVAYSDYPVFYSDNYYWRYDNGIWYSSPYYNGGWSVSYNVPYGVRGISRPYSYARFRPSHGWRRSPSPAYHGDWRYRNNRGPVVRDHRSRGRTYSPPARTYSTPRATTRDHRTSSPPARTYSPPRATTRDHRTSSPPARSGRSSPTVRDHRRR